MQNSTMIAIFVMVAAALSLVGTSSVFSADAYAQSERTQCQTGALIGYGGTIFGVANVCTNGYTINVDLATNYKPKEGWVFNAWLVDDSNGGSGYPLVMGKILNAGTLSFDQVQTNARTWTDIVVTQQPADSLSPLPSWSNSVAQTWLLPPFGR
jgi:hypothetical protein